MLNSWNGSPAGGEVRGIKIMRRFIVAAVAVLLSAGALVTAPSVQAAETLAGAVSVSGSVMSPNADGCADSLTIDVQMQWPDDSAYQTYNVYVQSQTANYSVGSATWYQYWGYDPLPTSASFTVPQWIADGTYRVYMQMYTYNSLGQSQNITVESPTTFRADTDAPTVLETGPQNPTTTVGGSVPYAGSVGVEVQPTSVGGTVYATFDESLAPENSVIDVVTMDGVQAEGVVRYDDILRRLTFEPSAPLVGRYRAVAVGQDPACNVGTATWNFTVAAPPSELVPAAP